MQKRSLVLALSAGVLLWGLGALEARAASVNFPLPPGTTLDQLTGANSANTASNGSLVFSNFTYSGPTPPAASAVGVNAFNLPGPPVETGLQFNTSWNAAAGVTSDWVVTYTVTSTGAPITDAYLAITGGLGTNGNGQITVSELIATTTGQQLALLNTSITAAAQNVVATANFAPQQSIVITKDIDVIGGTVNTSTLSVVAQAYSQTAVPEPATLTLLGIGMSGFLAFRRFFKRTSVA
jgi:hypothetical protein